MRGLLRVGAWVGPLLAAAAPGLAGAAPDVAAVAVTGKAAEDPELRSAIRAALERREDLVLAPDAVEARLFRSPAPPPIKPELSVARRAVRRATKALSGFDLDNAREHLENAEKALAPWSGVPEAIDLERDRLVLAVTLAHAQRKEDALTRALAAYAQRFPGEAPPKGAPWPPVITRQLEKLQPERDAKLQIRSTPAAEVFVDGRLAGTTPLEVTGLTRGEHRLIVEAPGHFRADQRVTASSEASAEVVVELAPDLSSALARVDLDTPLTEPLVASIRTRAAEAKIDRVVVADRRQSGAVTLQRIDVADAPGGPRVGAPVERVTLAALSPEELDRGVAQLFAGLPDAPVAAAQADVPVWAWAGLGAGALAVAIGTAFRLGAVGMQNDFEARQDALTQAEAFGLRDDADGQAVRGTVFIGAGAVALLGIGGWLAIQTLGASE